MFCEHEKCTGCMACVQACGQNAINIYKDNEGFWYPKILEESCIDCGACAKACPAQNPIASTDYEPTVYAAWNKNDEVRKTSSSGGVFRTIAEWIINNGGAVYGAEWSDDFDVVHCRKTTIESLKALSGSKYVQSYIGSCYTNVKEDLQDGKWVLFSGTPCQIAGLRAYLGRKYEKLLTIELVCHGVPSPGLFSDYIKSLEASHASKVNSITFRNKSAERSQNILITFENGSEYKTDDPMQDWYYRGFLAGALLRESCYKCQYVGAERKADITLGDFWGLDKEVCQMDYPSLVWINSKKGEAVWRELEDNFVTIVRSKDEAVAGNIHFKRSTPRHAKRDLFFTMYAKNGLIEQTIHTIENLDTWKDRVKRIIGPKLTAKVIRLLKR